MSSIWVTEKAFRVGFDMAGEKDRSMVRVLASAHTALGIFSCGQISFQRAILFSINRMRKCPNLVRTKLGLSAAESFANDFFRPRWLFEISVFSALRVGLSQGISETVERGKVSTIGALDGMLDAVIAWD
jgi:hypothetical protein